MCFFCSCSCHMQAALALSCCTAKERSMGPAMHLLCSDISRMSWAWKVNINVCPTAGFRYHEEIEEADHGGEEDDDED